MARGLVWEVMRPELLVISFYDELGTEAQWQGYVEMMKGWKVGESPRFFVYCVGAPAISELEGLVSVVRGKHWQVALVSPSTPVRFLASTFSLIVRGFRFFPPEQLTAAIQHLGSDRAEELKLRQVLQRLAGPESSLQV
jgi:hypothetical protein